LNHNDQTLPLVSIVIPMFNEIENIERCINSVLSQDYPQESIEIVVVDGGSTDGSKDKVAQLSKQRPNIRVKFNPDRLTPKSLNIGIKDARGDVVVILGAHTTLKEDFVRQNIEYMKQKNVKCVGGTQINIGESYIHQAIGNAMGSPFGFPSALYRYWKKEKFVDTVVYAAYKKELFDEIGYFDEELYISEDAELNWRVRKAGYKIYYTPKIVSYYTPRKSLAGLIKQLFRYGILRVNVIKKHIDAARLIHLVPALFILLTVILLLLSLFMTMFFNLLLTMWALYLLAIIFSAIAVGVRTHLKYILILPVIFISIHLSWGTGFIVGIFKSRYK